MSISIQNTACLQHLFGPYISRAMHCLFACQLHIWSLIAIKAHVEILNPKENSERILITKNKILSTTAVLLHLHVFLSTAIINIVLYTGL